MPHRLANDGRPISLRTQKEDALFHERDLSGPPERKARSTRLDEVRPISPSASGARRAKYGARRRGAWGTATSTLQMTVAACPCFRRPRPAQSLRRRTPHSRLSSGTSGHGKTERRKSFQRCAAPFPPFFPCPRKHPAERSETAYSTFPACRWKQGFRTEDAYTWAAPEPSPHECAVRETPFFPKSKVQRERNDESGTPSRYSCSLATRFIGPALHWKRAALRQTVEGVRA